MTNRFLYLNRFLQVTFHVNDSLRHSGSTRSSKMRFPDFGARGSMRDAGFSLSVAAHAAHVDARTIPTASPAESNAMGQSSGRSRTGT